MKLLPNIKHLMKETVNFVSQESQCLPRQCERKHWEWDSRETKLTV